MPDIDRPFVASFDQNVATGSRPGGDQEQSGPTNSRGQIVDIAGDTAVIHGVNTLIQDGEVIARERFSDVFVLQNGSWMALSAQEAALVG